MFWLVLCRTVMLVLLLHLGAQNLDVNDYETGCKTLCNDCGLFVAGKGAYGYYCRPTRALPVDVVWIYMSPLLQIIEIPRNLRSTYLLLFPLLQATVFLVRTGPSVSLPWLPPCHTVPRTRALYYHAWP